jgi:hypothetical protein
MLAGNRLEGCEETAMAYCDVLPQYMSGITDENADIFSFPTMIQINQLPEKKLGSYTV